MSKINQSSIKKENVLYDLAKSHLLNNDTVTKKILKTEHKVQTLFFWSNVAVLCGYLYQFILVARLYYLRQGTNFSLFLASLFLVYLFISIFLFRFWKSLAYCHGPSKSAIKTYLNYYSTKLTGQRRLIILYLLSYTLLLSLAATFFSSDMHDGLSALFYHTAPTSFFIYGISVYFLITFSRQNKKFKLLSKEIREPFLMDKYNLN